MNSKPLPHRLNEASWASEWPLLPQFGGGHPPSQSSLPDSMGWAWQTATSVRSAIDGTGNPVPLDVAHRFLDELENWTARHRALLTWPATPLSFARALVASAQQNDPTLAAVLVAYPDYCQNILDQARSVDPSLPGMGDLFRSAGPSPMVGAAPIAPTDPRVAAASPAAAPAPAPAPATPRRARQEIVPSEPPAFLIEWASKLASEQEPALARHYLDQQIKSSVSKFDGTPWQWFSRVLFPGLAALPAEQLQAVVDSWPSHNRFVPPDPVKVVDSAPFWIVLRDAGNERREIFTNGGLAAMLNLDDVSAGTKLEMATKMFPFVAKKPSAFRQRLRLWMSLGGDLDEHVAPDAVEGLSATSAREWISQQKNEEWNAVMDGLHPVPSGTRFGRRGPG